MIKKLIKNAMISRPGSRRVYLSARYFYHRFFKLRYFVLDAWHAYRFMKWGVDRKDYWAISAELLFYYHKLEKGLCMPNIKEVFGYDAARETLDIMAAWENGAFSKQDPVYQGAIETLRAYRLKIESLPDSQIGALRAEIDLLLSKYEANADLATPICMPGLPDDSLEHFDLLVNARRSVRNFSQRKVAINRVLNAVRLAQLAPSACNRQPCKVHFYDDPEKIKNLLALQNGNKGFGQTIPGLIVLTADSHGFFDASERNEPYIDGGLFAMTLILALAADGIASCCLNWCVGPDEDRLAHKIGALPEREKIIMYIGIGYAGPGSVVPRSPRRDADAILVTH